MTAGNTFTYKLYGSFTYGLSGRNFIFEYGRDALELQKASIGRKLQTSSSISTINSDTAGKVKIFCTDINAM